jgi:DNA-binding transcriptional ArsR family regulator
MVTELRSSYSGDAYQLWRFVTNHAHVLSCIAADPKTRLRDIAQTVGITERTVGQIVSQLEEAGYITKERVGRRTEYVVHGELPLRHPEHQEHTIGELIQFLQPPSQDGAASSKRPQKRR